MKNLKKHTLFIIISFVITLAFGTYWFLSMKNSYQVNANFSTENLKRFTTEELRIYDGTDPTKPIYLALDNQVYDITSGKEFYQVGGSYHYLAGKDSSKELHLVGGNIIKQKYPIVGILVP